MPRNGSDFHQHPGPTLVACCGRMAAWFVAECPAHAKGPPLPTDNSAKGFTSEEPLIAVFVDFENLAIGVRDMKAGQVSDPVGPEAAAGERAASSTSGPTAIGATIEDAVREFHAQGIELIDIPQSKMSGKNSADIRMVVDALDLCYSKQHIDVFALISGDSDFSPLVSKLKENNKRVIGCGVKSSTSDLLIANCDEFIYYDDLIRVAKKTQPPRRPPESDKKRKDERREDDKKQEAIDRVLEVLHSRRAGLRPAVGLAAQAGHPPRLPRLQRRLLRLPQLFRPARRHESQRPDRAGIRREPRELQSAKSEGLSKGRNRR